MADQIDEASQKWIDEHEQLMAEGTDLLSEAVTEALDYMTDAIENINDRQWRKMTMQTQIVEIGIGKAFAEAFMPIYRDMQKKMHKQLGIRKETATALQHILVGRVIKNIRKGLDERDSK